jgi:signal transduction histidine kinase
VSTYRAYVGLRPDGTRYEPTDWPLSRSILHGEVVRGEEVEIVRGDGTRAFIRIDSVPLRDTAGTIVAGVVFYDDVTEQRRGDEILRTLAEASRIVSSSLDHEKTLAAIASFVVPRLADWCAIDLLDEERKSFAHTAVAHADPAKVAFAQELRRRYPLDLQRPGGIGDVIRTGKPLHFPVISEELLVQSARDAEHLRLMREVGFHSAISVALRVGNETFGALSLIAAENKRAFDARDVVMAEDLAARCALAVKNARLYADAQRAIAQRDDFLSVAAHELRTPLHTLTLQASALEMAHEKSPDAPVPAPRIAKLRQSVERMASLVSNLLDVSRLASGRLALAHEDMDLGALTREIVDRLEDAATAAKCTITVRTDGDTRGRWDRERVDQIVTNLVTNAMKYGAGNSIDVDVRGDGDVVRLLVRDHGIGIAVADAQRIFRQFERATSRRHFSGLGLGLWIVDQFVRAHGGDVNVQSAPGEGATFTVTLPRDGGSA